ncbi:MAG: hypothetical protein EB084_04605 [Proteobacteria bacterium]|nr:hypothetical protein [Pseudomonadota bacterium]
MGARVEGDDLDADEALGLHEVGDLPARVRARATGAGQHLEREERRGQWAGAVVTQQDVVDDAPPL